MTRRPTFFVLTALLLALGGLALLAGSLSAPAQAAPDAGLATSEARAPAGAPAAELHVCPSSCAYSSVQAAVDAANDGDVIKVAAGTYTGVQNVPSLNTTTFTATQVVAITKSVTIRGGYTTADWATSDPDANPTILDAQGQGRVLYVIGWSVSTTIEGLHITGGDATGLGGTTGSYSRGGGVYVERAMATLNDNKVFGNTAGLGGGLYLDDSCDATLIGNTVSGNSADYGGGLYVTSDDATLTGNAVSGNSANDWGGGLYVSSDDATLIGNTVSDNSAASHGGGLSVSGDATLTGNTISGNNSNWGGGLYVYGSAGILRDNTIVSNTSQYNGGGIDIVSSQATVISNTIRGNTSQSQSGGGVSLSVSDSVLNGNHILGNKAEDWEEVSTSTIAGRRWTTTWWPITC